MATTTNYAWDTPDDTDLVKDGAAAIRTLGSSIDTTTKALNPSTTLGDIEYRSATANTNTRLGIGTSGQILTVSGGVPAWGAPPSASAAIAQIASGTTTSGTSLSLTSLTAYDTLKFRITGVETAATAQLNMQINSSSSAVYDRIVWGAVININSYDGGELQTYNWDTAASLIPMTQTRSLVNTGADNYFMVDFYNCKATGFTTYEWQSRAVMSIGANYRQYNSGRGIFKTAAAVSSIQFNTSSAFTAGSYVLWGA